MSDSVTGEQLYMAWRKSMQRAARVRGLNAEPRWKNLKPWLRKVWERAASELEVK